MPKTVSIKAIDPCSIKRYEKDFYGVKVEIRRESFDDWNDLKLTIPDGVELPEIGVIFSPHALGIEYYIEKFSGGCYVQKTVITEIKNENIESALDENEANDDWKLIGPITSSIAIRSGVKRDSEINTREILAPAEHLSSDSFT